MAFNSDTYHANKNRRAALKELALARDIKARAAKGEAYDWEVETMLPTLVRAARLDWHIYLMYRSFKPGRMAPRRLA